MRRILGLLVTAVLVVAAGCGSSGDDSGEASGGSQQVKVGVIPIVDVAPIYLGEQKGFFANRDIELTLEAATSGG